MSEFRARWAGLAGLALFSTTAFGGVFETQFAAEGKAPVGGKIQVRFGPTAPAAAEVATLSFVSGKGMVLGTFEKIEKDCFEQAGEEDPTKKECHALGIYRVADPGKLLGSGPVVAVTGKIAATKFRAIEAKKLDVPIETQLKSWVTPDFVAAEVRYADAASYRYRWEMQAGTGKPMLDFKYKSSGDTDPGAKYYDSGQPPKPFVGTGCRLETVDVFTRLTCPDAAWLYRGKKLIALSTTDDYGVPELTFHGAFEFDGAPAYLVSYGTKGRKVIGILIEKNGVWSFLDGPAHGPGLCSYDRPGADIRFS